MGIILLKKEKNQSLGIWKISESINELNALTKGVKLDQIKSQKRKLVTTFPRIK